MQTTAIWLAIVAFYILDFALNALQASLRNLLLDVTPPEQLNAGNAWHSRMANAGNIVGYGFGKDPFLPPRTFHQYHISRLPAARELADSKTPWWRSVPEVLCCRNDHPCGYGVGYLLVSRGESTSDEAG